MKCPICESSNIRVTDVRPIKGKLRRRRKCQECEERFTTFEVEESHLGELLEDIQDDQIRIAVMEAFEKIYLPLKPGLGRLGKNGEF